MRVLLVGSGGMLGRDLGATAPLGVTVDARARADLDVRDSRRVAAALEATRPDWVVNASAYTAVDRAESEREAAFAVNGAAVGALGAACARQRVRVLHFSTDYVFPGTATAPYDEDAATAAVNAYGESKLAGELALAQSGAEALVVRTQWLFGAGGRSFPRTMAERAARGQRARVVADQWGRPTYTVDLARAAWALVSRNARGIYHVANSGVATWFEVAARVYTAAGVPELVERCATADYPTPARRPRYAVLDTQKADALVGPLPPWEDALDRFLAQVSLAATA